MHMAMGREMLLVCGRKPFPRRSGSRTTALPGQNTGTRRWEKKQSLSRRCEISHGRKIHSIGALAGKEVADVSADAPASCFLLSLTMPLTVALGILGANLTPPPWNILLSSTGALQTLVVLPMLDAIVGQEQSFQPKGMPQGKEPHSSAYRHVLYIYACTHILVLALGILGASRLEFLPMVGGILSLGVMGGLGYTAVHELVHGRAKMEHTLASVMLSFMWAMHWRRSHLLHHKHVGKRQDPSTARKGENFYAFALRSISGNIKNGVEDARARGHSSAPLWWVACPATLACMFVLLGGIRAGFAFVSQACVAAIILETVNYIQHYGLERKQSPGGEYEPYSVKHSWNANWKCSNAFAFNLQHHAEHHLHASKPYHKLHNVEGAPKLPMSYPVLMMLSLAPPLFRSIMDKELNELSQASRLSRPAA